MESQIRIKVNGPISVSILRAALDSIPGDAEVRIKTHFGDRSTSEWHTITATWNTDLEHD